MADSSALDAALTALLLNDATLMALVPDGVYFDQAAGTGAQRYVQVSITSAIDTTMFGGRAFEAPTYLVLACMLSSAGGNIAAAAARIDELLDGTDLAATGYAPAPLQRMRRVRQSDPDGLDPSLRWHTRGGEYGALVAPL